LRLNFRLTSDEVRPFGSARFSSHYSGRIQIY
jgi:hypothetical protein